MIEPKYDSSRLFIETYNQDSQFENEESTDKIRKSDKEESVDLSHYQKIMKKKKNRKRIKNLELKKILTRLPILLTQTKAGKNLQKSKKWNQTNTVSFVSA